MSDQDPIDRLAWELSTYAAAVDWGGGPNTAGWLRGLRDRIEAVQGHLLRTGRAGDRGMVTNGPRLLDGRHDLASGDWEVVVGQFEDGRWWWRIDGQDRTIAEGEADGEDEANEAAEAAMERVL